MVTPIEVDRVEFDSRSFFMREWYDADEVDEFLDRCRDTIRALAQAARIDFNDQRQEQEKEQNDRHEDQ